MVADAERFRQEDEEAKRRLDARNDLEDYVRPERTHAWGPCLLGV